MNSRGQKWGKVSQVDPVGKDKKTTVESVLDVISPSLTMSCSLLMEKHSGFITVPDKSGMGRASKGCGLQSQHP